MAHIYDTHTTEIRNLECPFCKKEAVKVIYYPPVLQSSTSRSASKGSRTKLYHTKERYEIVSGCSNCGKNKKEIMKAFREGTKEEKERRKKRLEELKKIGFSGKIETKL